MREDITDDTGAHADVRAAADQACGWNGSLTLYVPDDRPGDPCPPSVLARLKVLREAAERRAAEQRKRGQCL